MRRWGQMLFRNFKMGNAQQASKKQQNFIFSALLFPAENTRKEEVDSRTTSHFKGRIIGERKVGPVCLRLWCWRAKKSNQGSLRLSFQSVTTFQSWEKQVTWGPSRPKGTPKMWVTRCVSSQVWVQAVHCCINCVQTTPRLGKSKRAELRSYWLVLRSFASLVAVVRNHHQNNIRHFQAPTSVFSVDLYRPP